MRWDPARYERYADERSRPFFDLTARIDADAPRAVVDLGCGPGGLTATLAQRWPHAEVIGIDSSPEMIAAASAAAAEVVPAGPVTGAPGRLRFELGDLATWHPTATTDVVISNAALQWVPTHRELVRRWCGELPAGAWLAWQVPGNFGAPSHVLMRELAESAAWRDRLHGVLRHDDATDLAERYLELLQNAGLHGDAWETTYLHVLQGEDPVLDWVRGTGLRPVLQALSPEDAAAFEADYAAALRDAYPVGPQGTVYPFRRVFAVGRVPV
jgi:trans-aconitate 2-methyltransferase